MDRETTRRAEEEKNERAMESIWGRTWEEDEARSSTRGWRGGASPWMGKRTKTKREVESERDAKPNLSEPKTSNWVRRGRA